MATEKDNEGRVAGVDASYDVVSRDEFGFYGEDLSPNAPLYSFASRSKAELPAQSALGSEKDILRSIVTANKYWAHNGLGQKGVAYRNVSDPLALVSIRDETVALKDGSTDEVVVVSDIDKHQDANCKIRVRENGVEQEYAAITLDTGEYKGVIAQAFITTSIDEKTKKEVKQLRITFRGTSDGATLAADLENGGAGFESLNKVKDRLMGQVNRLIGKHNITEMTITGHSLGGGLAQQFQHYVCTGRAQEHGFVAHEESSITPSNRTNLSRLTNVKGFFYNAAGFKDELPQRNDAALEYLYKHNAGLKVEGHYYLEDGDAVQLTDRANLFAHTRPEHAIVSMVKVVNGHKGQGLKRGLAGAALGAATGFAVGSIAGPVGSAICMGVGTVIGAAVGAGPVALATHCNKHFTGDQVEALGYEIATNETEAGRQMIREKLGNKSGVLNNPVTKFVQSELVEASRHGKIHGAVSLAGVAAGIWKGGAAGGLVGGPVGMVAGAVAGGVVGAIAGSRLAGAASAVADKLNSVANNAAARVNSAASSVKNFFFGPKKAEAQTQAKIGADRPVPTPSAAPAAIEMVTLRSDRRASEPRALLFAGPQAAGQVAGPQASVAARASSTPAAPANAAAKPAPAEPAKKSWWRPF